jgi:hypothetical protein
MLRGEEAATFLGFIWNHLFLGVLLRLNICVNGQVGRFEYLLGKSGNLTHQRFVPNGTVAKLDLL